MSCPICLSDDAVELGFLGDLHWFRCESCGTDYNEDLDPSLNEGFELEELRLEQC